MRYKNSDVLDMFIGYEGYKEVKNHTNNLYVDNRGFLINYTTIIALIYEGQIYVSKKKYSSTTSRHQNYLKARGAKELEHEDFLDFIDKRISAYYQN